MISLLFLIQGLLRTHSEDDRVKRLILSAAAGRVLKDVLREKNRDVMFVENCPSDLPFVEVCTVYGS